MTKADRYAIIRIRWYLGDRSFKLIDTARSKGDALRIIHQTKEAEYTDILSVISIDDISGVLDRWVHIDVYFVDSRLRIKMLPNLRPISVDYIEKLRESIY